MLKNLAVITAVLLLAGCVAPKQTYNTSANKHLNAIAVIKPANPEEISVNIMHHPGANFGLIGGLIAAADISAKTSKYQESIVSIKINWADLAQHKIVDSLEEAGYTVTSVTKDKRESGRYLEHYKGENVDAYLDYYFSLAYIATSPTSDYTPSVLLNVRLVEAQSKAILYEDQIAFGYHFEYGEPVHIPSSGTYLYNDIDILCHNGIKSVEALREGIIRVADKIASHLRKNSIHTSRYTNLDK